ncbi:MAG: TolC family protein [Prevotella sp.]|nr:TolC family protein [Prevotella sp.]
MKKLLLSFIISHLAFSPVGAQEPWSLERCIDYAVSHNITIEQYKLRTEKQTIQLQTSKASRLPDLNASVGENFSFGRGLTADNTYTNKNTSSTNFSVGTSVPIFTGFQIPNQIKLNQLNLEAATQDLEKAKNDIRTQVAQEYVQTLYNMEILDVARRQVTIDSAQVARLQALMDAGRASQAEVSQQKATLAQSRLTVTQAENNLRLALLNLSQLLELDSPEGFSIERPAVPLSCDSVAAKETAPDAIFATALTSRPEIAADQLRLRAADHSIKIAQAGLYPTLSFSAGLGTNYYSTSGFKSDGFGTQLKNNFSQYLGFNLSIPIFNRFQTRNSIRSARLDRVTQQLQFDQTKKALYKEIQQAWYNSIAAAEKLRSSDEARRASQDAFQLVQAKYEQGKTTITEFNEAKNNYLKTESDLTQARFEHLYQQTLLQFYRGEPLRF